PEADAVVPLGSITEKQKAELFSSADIYVAPQTGGESFGIVLVEAMSAGTNIVASNLHAFEAVLDGGRAGYLFNLGDSEDLVSVVTHVLTESEEARGRRDHGQQWVRKFDWPAVAGEIYEVYRMVSVKPDIVL